MTIIEWLNENVDAGDAIIYLLIAYVLWYILWKIFLRKLFRKCPVGSLGEHLSDLGATGIFGICLFILLILTLLVTSIQLTWGYGWTLIFPLAVFWGGIFAFAVFLMKVLKKK